jgi:hypothetical protein
MKTPNDGARAERREIVAHIENHPAHFLSKVDLLKWIRARRFRVAKRKGGLGRR